MTDRLALEGSALGPEVRRMQARGETREFTACDEGLREMHESSRMRAKQEWDGARTVRGTQRDADGSRRHAQ